MRDDGQFFTAIGACSLALVFFVTAAGGQDPLENAPLAPGSMPKAGASEKATADSADKTEAKSETSAKPEFIVRSPAKWRRLLTKMQFSVTRQIGLHQAGRSRRRGDLKERVGQDNVEGKIEGKAQGRRESRDG
jgi:hypothetical protein